MPVQCNLFHAGNVQKVHWTYIARPNATVHSGLMHRIPEALEYMYHCVGRIFESDAAPPTAIDSDDGPTDPCCAPTSPSRIDAETAWQLAQHAATERDYDSAKHWMQYYNQQTRS